jgi:hypothetical protein
MDSRSRAAFALLIAAQAAHSVEECVTRLFDVFAPARFMAGIFTSNLPLGFAIANAIIVLFGAWCYFARVRTPHVGERAYAWFWTVLEAGNGTGHLVLALANGGYFPGAATAPFLLAISWYLGARLVTLRGEST